MGGQIVMLAVGILLVLLLVLSSSFRGKKLDLRSADRMKGPEFEQWCAKLLKRNGYRQVKVIGGSGDFGVDILAWKGLRKYAIQCKRYSGKVGFDAVKEANAGVEYYHAHVAVVMTNSYFTTNAIKGAKKCHVTLWDRDHLKTMLR